MTTKPAQPENRFQQVCPRRLTDLPGSPCPLAIERINALKALKENRGDVDETTGCDWYATSADANFCFFSQIASDPGPYSDDLISIHLSIPVQQVESLGESGIQKMQENKEAPEMNGLKEALIEITEKRSDNLVYMPDTFVKDRFSDFEEKEAEKPLDDPDKKIKVRKKSPKAQLYGLYSQAKLKQIQKERDEANKTKQTRKKKKPTP